MQQGTQGQQSDHSSNFFWLLALIAGTLVVMWFFARHWIIAPVFFARLHELSMIQGIAGLFTDIAQWFHFSLPKDQVIDQLQNYIQATPAKDVTYENFMLINTYVGDWIRYPAMFLLLVMAAVTQFNHTSGIYRRSYNMKDLKNFESQNWPQIKPVLSLDLVREDIRKGPWAMAKHPLEFAKEHNLAFVEEKGGRRIWSLHRGITQQHFVMQLGPLWSGPDKLPIHVKAILVIFIARSKRERDVAKKFLVQIAASAASGKLDFTGVEEQMEKYRDAKAFRFLAPKHAYLYTLMMSLLEIARIDGVLATAEFLWLKPVDRRLWYVLNSVGRQTAFVEVGGAFSHWKAEKKVGRALKTPMVKEAMIGLEHALTKTLYVADGEKWHSKEE